MRKEQITDKEAICTLILFIMGSTLILGIGGEAKQDAWLAGIVGIVFASPMLLIYSRIQSVFPGKNLFEILELSLGKVAGKAVSVIYILYAFHLGALVLRNLGEFMITVVMPETPIFVSLFCMGMLCIVAARLGIEEIGRFSAYLLPIVIAILFFVNLLSIKEWNLDYLRPVMENGIAPVLSGGFSTFAFPFAEAVLFLGVLFSLKSTKSVYKTYFFSLLLAGSVIIFLTIRNTVMLGKLASMLYFPSHVAVSRINVMDFLQRIEITVAVTFVIGVFVKSSICLFVAGKGIAGLFHLNDYRSVVIQLGILMILFSYTIYNNIMEMRYWAFKVYQYYAFAMQVILPVILWIFAEIRHKRDSAQINKDSCKNTNKIKRQ